MTARRLVRQQEAVACAQRRLLVPAAVAATVSLLALVAAVTL